MSFLLLEKLSGRIRCEGGGGAKLNFKQAVTTSISKPVLSLDIMIFVSVTLNQVTKL